MVLVVKNPLANAGDIRDMGSTPELRRFPGGGHGNPVQYSCLENPTESSRPESIGSQLSDMTELLSTRLNYHLLSINCYLCSRCCAKLVRHIP